MRVLRLLAVLLVLCSFEMAARGGGGRGGGGRGGAGRANVGRGRPVQRTPTLSRAAYRSGYRRGAASYGYGGGYYYDTAPSYYYPSDPYYYYYPPY